jgi:hypothetical protein
MPRSFHSSGSRSPASHRGGPTSAPGRFTFYLWRTQRHCYRFFSEYFGVPRQYHSASPACSLIHLSPALRRVLAIDSIAKLNTHTHRNFFQKWNSAPFNDRPHLLPSTFFHCNRVLVCRPQSMADVKQSYCWPLSRTVYFHYVTKH